ncbi:MAG: 8-oxoguanine deaminase [Gammaproteobacteria bacterium]|nr:8-oxoguanine deaminase [Gammaproteobacteria bacterium]
MRTWIKNPLAILVDETVNAGGGIVIEQDRIDEYVPKGGEPSSPVDHMFDASAHVVLPGLINTHHHYYQTLTRAVPAALNKGLFPWLKTLYPIWAGLDEEMIYLSTQLAATELLLSGCTTSSDHHYIYPHAAPNALDIQVEALAAVGIRSTVTRGSMSLGEEQGGLPPQNTIQTEDAILSDCERAVGQYHDPSEGSMLQIAFAPCSPFSVTEQLMVESAALARKLNVRLHTHLAETHDETQFCLERFGCRPVDYLERVGWLSDDVWLAHGIFFNDEEIDRLGKARVGITHCPSSNMLLGSGQCQVEKLEGAGSPVGLGVDGSASNDCSNLIQEVRQALLLQRLQYGAHKISHTKALNWATKGSAACLGRQEIGELSVGKQADVALFTLDDLRFSGAGDPLAALILCGAEKADAVMVKGEWKVIKGECLGIDIHEMKQRHGEIAEKLQHG